MRKSAFSKCGRGCKNKTLFVEYIRACHSSPDGVSFGIKTPVGNIIFTGDFKIDYTPIDGDKMDLHRIAQWGVRRCNAFVRRQYEC